ncbi:MAG: C-terminal binding protein [Spirochaetota bacterium]
MFRVVVTDDRFGSYSEENEVLKELGIEVEVHNLQTEREGKKVLSDVDGIIVNLFPLPASIITELRRCKVISRYGVGYDNVDVTAATKRGIWVARVPDYCIEDVSDHALSLLLSCIRGVAFKDRMVRAGKWNVFPSNRISRIQGKVLGLLGYGGIARCLHKKAAGFGLGKVLVCDPFIGEKAIREAGAEPAAFDTLLKNSDYISIHVPLNNETRGMIGSKEFELMKEDVIIINTSRGPIIDETALYGALKNSQKCAGIDVFETEPLPGDSPLRTLENITLTDHAGFYSVESIKELKTKAAGNVLEVLKGNKPLYPVNSLQ